MFIFANVMVIWDEVSRHLKYNKEIENARKDVRRYKMNPEEIETTFFRSDKIAAKDKILKTADIKE